MSDKMLFIIAKTNDVGGLTYLHADGEYGGWGEALEFGFELAKEKVLKLNKGGGLHHPVSKSPLEWQNNKDWAKGRKAFEKQYKKAPFHYVPYEKETPLGKIIFMVMKGIVVEGFMFQEKNGVLPVFYDEQRLTEELEMLYVHEGDDKNTEEQMRLG